MREMGTEQEHQNGNHKKEFLCRCILIPIIDLLPHVQIVVGSSVELKGDASDPVEHQERGAHVGNVDEGP